MTDLYRVEWHFVHVTWTPLLHYKCNTGGFSSSGMKHCVIGWVVSDNLKHHGGFIFKSQAILWGCSSWTVEDVDVTVLWNVRIRSPSDTTSHPERLESSATPLWKSQISQLYHLSFEKLEFILKESIFVAGNKPTSIYFITFMMQWNPVVA